MLGTAGRITMFPSPSGAAQHRETRNEGRTRPAKSPAAPATAASGKAATRCKIGQRKVRRSRSVKRGKGWTRLPAMLLAAFSLLGGAGTGGLALGTAAPLLLRAQAAEAAGRVRYLGRPRPLPRLVMPNRPGLAPAPPPLVPPSFERREMPGRTAGSNEGRILPPLNDSGDRVFVGPPSGFRAPRPKMPPRDRDDPPSNSQQSPVDPMDACGRRRSLLAPCPSEQDFTLPVEALPHLLRSRGVDAPEAGSPYRNASD
jgi:hypothetical protein